MSNEKQGKYLNSIKNISQEAIFGRAKNVAEMHEKLRYYQNLVITQELNGFGKSCLAHYYAQTYQEAYQYILVIDGANDFILSIIDDTTLIENLAISEEFYERLYADGKIAAFDFVVKTILSFKAPILWVFTNANKRIFDWVQSSLDTTKANYFLLTAPKTENGLVDYPLPPLPQEAALQIFYHYASQVNRTSANDAILYPVLQKINSHPFLTILIAQNIQLQSNIQLNTIASSYCKSMDKLNQRIRRSPTNIILQYTLYESVRFLLSSSKLIQDETVVHLLIQLSILPSIPLQHKQLAQLLVGTNLIPLKASLMDKLSLMFKVKTFSMKDLDTALNNLVQNGFLQQDTTNNNYCMSDFIKQIIHHIHEIKHQDIKEIADKLIFVLEKENRILTFEKGKYIAIIHSILYHLTTKPEKPFIEYYQIGNRQYTYKDNSKTVSTLAFRLGTLYNEIGLYEQAMNAFQNALRHLDSPYKKDTLLLKANLHFQMAKCSNANRNLYAAIENYEQTILIWEDLLPDNHLQLADIYVEIANIYYTRLDHTKAIDYYQKSQKIWENRSITEEKEWKHLSQIYLRIVAAYQAKKDHKMALIYAEKLKKIFAQFPPENSKELALMHYNLADFFVKQSDYKEALISFDKALAIWEDVGAKNDLANAYNDLSLVYHQLAEFDKGLEVIQKAINIRLEAPNKQTYYLRPHYNMFGLLLYEKGDYIQAKTVFEKLAVICDKKDTRANSWLSYYYNNMGAVYEKIGNYEKSLTYYQQAQSIREKVFPITHPHLGYTYMSLASLYLCEGDVENAKIFLEKGKTNYQKNLSHKHEDMGYLYLRLGEMSQHDKEYIEALEYYEQALAIFHLSLPPEHPYTALAYHLIGKLHEAERNYTKALASLEKAKNIREQIFSKNHPDIATSYHDIASIYQQQDKYSLALDFYLKALAIREEIIPQHDRLLSVHYHNIGILYEEFQQYAEALAFFEKAKKSLEKLPPKYQIETGIECYHIAKIYLIQNQIEDAFINYKKSFTLLTNQLALNHTYSKIVLQDYKNALQNHQEQLPKDVYEAHNSYIMNELLGYLRK